MKKIVIFGAGIIGEIALEHYGRERVIAFADNAKTGTFCELPVWSMADLRGRADTVRVVIASILHEEEITDSLKKAGITDFDIFEGVKNEDEIDTSILSSFKDIHKGRRCFIIGTGPSLRMEDLETLRANGEICIGSNKIFLAFEQTKWRPDYYIVTDRNIINQYGNEISMTPVKHKFVTHHSAIIRSDGKSIPLARLPFWDSDYSSDSIGFRLKVLFPASIPPYFSTDLCDCIYEGDTVTYAAIQMAVYMGFDEIYLLGIDFCWSGDTAKGENHFINNYIKKGEVFQESTVSRVLSAYQKAESFSREHGFRIFNATRGGKLEVFVRVNFDSLF